MILAGVVLINNRNESYANIIVERVFSSDYPLSFVWTRKRGTPNYIAQTGAKKIA